MSDGWKTLRFGEVLSCSEDMIFLRRRGDLERYLLSGHSG